MALGLLVGCAPTQPMALDDMQAPLELGNDTILLLRLHTVNELKPGFQPEVLGIRVVNLATHEPITFKPIARPVVQGQGYEYLVSLRLPSGQYEIATLNGMSFGYHLQAYFEVPLHRQVAIPPGKVIYLGRIDARNVCRTSDEQPPSGPQLPLIDQTVAGYCSGTFQIDIEDRFNEDLDVFRKSFPALRSLTVERLPSQG